MSVVEFQQKGLVTSGILLFSYSCAALYGSAQGPALNFIFIFRFNSRACLATCIQHCFAWLGDIDHVSSVLLML
jgi:hypothetical protein